MVVLYGDRVECDGLSGDFQLDVVVLSGDV